MIKLGCRQSSACLQQPPVFEMIVNIASVQCSREVLFSKKPFYRASDSAAMPVEPCPSVHTCEIGHIENVDIFIGYSSINFEALAYTVIEYQSQEYATGSQFERRPLR